MRLTLRSRAAFLCVGLFTVAGAVAAERPFDFGFTPTGGPLRPPAPAGVGSLAAADCVACHADVGREWGESMHARSFTDPVFQAELGETADGAHCRACHAPLAEPAALRSPMHAEGVSCAACHVRAGAVLTTRAPTQPAPHVLRVVPELSSAEFCAGCHEFRFPALPRGREIPYDPNSPQQMTLSEWRRSPHAARGVDCVDCHMPTVTRESGLTGRSHRVRSLEEPDFVRTALRVSASAHNTPEGTHVRLRIEAPGAGHAVPTGDIFRILRVRVAGSGGEATRDLTRGFAEQPGRHGWVLADSWDDRVQPNETKVLEWVLPRSVGDVRYDLSILRTDPEQAARRNLPASYIAVPLTSGAVTIAP